MKNGGSFHGKMLVHQLSYQICVGLYAMSSSHIPLVPLIYSIHIPLISPRDIPMIHITMNRGCLPQNPTEILEISRTWELASRCSFGRYFYEEATGAPTETTPGRASQERWVFHMFFLILDPEVSYDITIVPTSLIEYFVKQMLHQFTSYIYIYVIVVVSYRLTSYNHSSY